MSKYDAQRKILISEIEQLDRTQNEVDRAEGIHDRNAARAKWMYAAHRGSAHASVIQRAHRMADRSGEGWLFSRPDEEVREEMTQQIEKLQKSLQEWTEALEAFDGPDAAEQRQLGREEHYWEAVVSIAGTLGPDVWTRVAAYAEQEAGEAWLFEASEMRRDGVTGGVTVR